MNTKLKLLLLAAVLLVTRAQAAVRVYGEAASTGPEISVKVYADITDTAIVSHTFKLFYNPADLQLIEASQNLDVWFLHDGTATVPYPAPNDSQPGEILFTGAHMDGRNPRSGVTGNRVLLGSARFVRSNPNTPSFDLSLGHGGHFANFVDTNAQTLEVIPDAVRILSVKANPADEDLDGLSDRWEDKFFGGTRGAGRTSSSAARAESSTPTTRMATARAISANRRWVQTRRTAALCCVSPSPRDAGAS